MDVFRPLGRDAGDVALDDGTTTRTRGELADRLARLVDLYRSELGLAAGRHAAMLVGNRVEFVELGLAALGSGAWMTPVSGHLTPDEIAYVLSDSGARVVFADDEHLDLVHRGTARSDVEVVEVGPSLESALSTCSDEPPDPGAPPGGNMFYTSGTTGRPKGVKRARRPTIGEAVESLAGAGRSLGLDGSLPHLVTGPLYHAAPLGFAVMDLFAGSPVVIMPRFDATGVLQLVDERAIGHTHVVPTMCVRLLAVDDDARARFDGSTLELVLHGAAPISEGVKRGMIDWWGPVLVEYWGASEGGVVTLIDSADWLAHPGSVGRPTPTHEVFAADDDGNELPVGRIGQLWCRNTSSEQVFEYHRAPEKTATAHRSGGTYTLGDLGCVDDEGYVYLSDRRANLIISGGVNIYPAEVERVLGEHPAVRDVAVFGVPDAEWGQRVVAAVELHDDVHDDVPGDPAGAAAPDGTGAEIVVEELRAFARERLAGYKVPRQIHLEDRLPRQDNGKLYVRPLVDRYSQIA